MIIKYLPPILAALGIGFAVLTAAKGSKTLPPMPPVVEPATPPFVSSVAGAGIVEANTENIAIGTHIPGVVSHLYVSVGSKVRAGDPLFKLDDRDLRAQLAVRRASLRVANTNVKVARASLADLENQLTLAERLTDKRAISVEELDRRRFAVCIARAKLAQSRADVVSEKTQIKETEMNLERIIVRAPVVGEILQSKIHPGEYAPAGIPQTPLMLLGNVEPFNVRVDVDENDAWRVRQGSPAVAFLRGNREMKTPLKFIRFEPYIIPKKSLTGDSIERVDTRVLQVIYRIENDTLPVFAGQQMDVFIEPQDTGKDAGRSQQNGQTTTNEAKS